MNVFEGWGTWTKIGIIADCILDDLGVEHGDHLVEVMVELDCRDSAFTVKDHRSRGILVTHPISEPRTPQMVGS